MADLNEYIRIVEKYRKPLFKYCYYRLQQDQTLAEETFDDVIHVLYQKWDSLDVGEHIRAYLYRVADRCIKRSLEKHRRYYRHNESLDEALEAHRLEPGEYCDVYFQREELSEEEAIAKIRETLPVEYRPLFVHRYIEKKTLMEISAQTGIPYSSLRLRIGKLERLIRDEIRKMFQ